MLSRLISMRRLRSYEELCRQQASTEPDEFSRTELTKFADSFRQAVDDLGTDPDTDELDPPVNEARSKVSAVHH
jgi:hypothetical protein